MSSRTSALSPADGGTLRASPRSHQLCHSDRRRSASDGKWRNLLFGNNSIYLVIPKTRAFHRGRGISRGSPRSHHCVIPTAAGASATASGGTCFLETTPSTLSSRRPTLFVAGEGSRAHLPAPTIVSFRPPPERQRRQVEEPASAHVGRTLLSAASCKRYKANPYLNPFTTYASDMASEY